MKLQSIQILRGFAALLVVIYHIRAMEALAIANNGLTESPLLNGLITNGYAGVDLFFIISGFIMVFVTHGAKSGVRTSGDFLFARATRVYPVWWAFAGIMTIYMTMAHVLPVGAEGWQTISRSQPPLDYFVKSFLLLPQPEFPILGVGWTLVHEMYFYAVFAALLLMPRRLLPVLLALWACAIVLGGFLGFSAPYAGTIIQLVFYPMTFEFILGAFAGLLVAAGRIWRPGIVFLFGTVWLLAALCFQGLETEETLTWGRVLWFGLPCAVLIYGLSGLELKDRISWLIPGLIGFLAGCWIYQLSGLSDKSADLARQDGTLLAVIIAGLVMLMVFWIGWLLGQAAPGWLRSTQPVFASFLRAGVRIGDWSFSLYLCHMIVLSALSRVFETLGKQEILAPYFRMGSAGPLDNLAFLVTGMGLSLAAAWLTYRYIEKPWIVIFGNLRRSIFHSPSRRNAAE